jgi:hypothetical protein
MPHTVSQTSIIDWVTKILVALADRPYNHIHRIYWLSIDFFFHSQNSILQSTPTNVQQTTSASQPDLHNVAAINDSRSSFVDQRPFRIVQDFPQSRNSPSNFQSSGYISQNPPMPSYVAPSPGQNSERCSPTRTGGRVRNRVCRIYFSFLFHFHLNLKVQRVDTNCSFWTFSWCLNF